MSDLDPELFEYVEVPYTYLLDLIHLSFQFNLFTSYLYRLSRYLFATYMYNLTVSGRKSSQNQGAFEERWQS